MANVTPIVSESQDWIHQAGRSSPLITPSPIADQSSSSTCVLPASLIPVSFVSREHIPATIHEIHSDLNSTSEQSVSNGYINSSGIQMLSHMHIPQPARASVQYNYLPESSMAQVSTMSPHYATNQPVHHPNQSTGLPQTAHPMQQQPVQEHPLHLQGPVRHHGFQEQGQAPSQQSRIFTDHQVSQNPGDRQTYVQLDQTRVYVQPLPLEFRRTHPDLTPVDVEDGGNRFLKAVRNEVFLYDALPEFHAQAATVKILKELHDINDPNDELFRYTAIQDIVQTLTIIASGECTKCQTAAANWLANYHFRFTQFIPPEDDTVNERVEMYKQLIEKSRFAREDYRLDGPLLQNKCIADCMSAIFCHPNSSRPRLRAIPRPTPHSMIAYTYSLIYYRLAHGCKHDQVKKPKEKSFQKDSDWAKVYQHVLDPESDFGKTVDWEGVQEFLAEALPDSNDHGDPDGFDPHDEHNEQHRQQRYLREQQQKQALAGRSAKRIRFSLTAEEQENFEVKGTPNSILDQTQGLNSVIQTEDQEIFQNLNEVSGEESEAYQMDQRNPTQDYDYFDEYDFRYDDEDINVETIRFYDEGEDEDQAAVTSRRLFMSSIKHGGTRAMFDDFIKITNEYIEDSNEPLYSHKRSVKQLKKRYPIEPIQYHMCQDGCMMFQLNDSRTACYVCGKPRYNDLKRTNDGEQKKDQPYATVLQLPLKRQLALLIHNSMTRDEILYRARYPVNKKGVYSDIFDGKVYKKMLKEGKFATEHPNDHRAFDQPQPISNNSLRELQYDLNLYHPFSA
ncbi:hypothetical protein BJV82DRAFT_674459 [Fennellomyces sp. T-0311]|nr:hypothetical protein BJV82DRAFT_674459 [Fennellomyces sp. T-0311]